MIPKKIYFFWGNAIMSWMRYMTLKSFRQMNPSWEMILYISQHNVMNKVWKMDNYQDFFCFKGENYIGKIKDLKIDIRQFKENKDMTPSHASNFFKWKILSTDGGIYSDMDILYFKPMDLF